MTNLALPNSPKLQVVGGCFLVACQGLNTLDLTPIKNVQQIGPGFLYNCNKLKKLDFSAFSDISTIYQDKDGFLGRCDSLEEITMFDRDPKQILWASGIPSSEDFLEGVSSEIPIYVKKEYLGSEDEETGYRGIAPWSYRSKQYQEKK